MVVTLKSRAILPTNLGQIYSSCGMLALVFPRLWKICALIPLQSTDCIGCDSRKLFLLWLCFSAGNFPVDRKLKQQQQQQQHQQQYTLLITLMLPSQKPIPSHFHLFPLSVSSSVQSKFSGENLMHLFTAIHVCILLIGTLRLAENCTRNRRMTHPFCAIFHR